MNAMLKPQDVTELLRTAEAAPKPPMTAVEKLLRWRDLLLAAAPVGGFTRLEYLQSVTLDEICGGPLDIAATERAARLGEQHDLRRP